MIITDTYEDTAGQQRKRVSIDLSDKGHPNRVLDFCESIDPIGRRKFEICAHWAGMPAMMFLDEKGMLELAGALNNIAEEIRRSKTLTEVGI